MPQRHADLRLTQAAWAPGGMLPPSCSARDVVVHRRHAGAMGGWGGSLPRSRPRRRARALLAGTRCPPTAGVPMKPAAGPPVVQQRKSSAIRIVNPNSKEEVKGDFKKP